MPTATSDEDYRGILNHLKSALEERELIELAVRDRNMDCARLWNQSHRRQLSKEAREIVGKSLYAAAKQVQFHPERDLPSTSELFKTALQLIELGRIKELIPVRINLIKGRTSSRILSPAITEIVERCKAEDPKALPISVLRKRRPELFDQPLTMLEIEGIDTIQWIGVYRWRGDSNASQLLSRFIREFKVGEKLYIEFLTFLATQFLEESRDLIEKVDVLVPVPADPDRASERGHDLAADIATATSLAFAIPMEQPLMRMSGSPNSRFCSFDELFQQFRLDERFKNGYDGIKVLLVDDIVTRGNTMRVCARFLRSAGALSVCGFSIARSESTNKSANALMS